ncbi:NUDIX domain-containing protein [Oricola thermophila]|nr:NUDIX domain-containing protein [Oricola thermophila]
MKPDLRTRLFHAWFLLTRPMTLGVRALALDEGGRVLLVRHTYVDGWHLPGGGVETGETVHDALEKELREEANAELGAPPRLHSIHFNRQATRRDHVVLFHCDKVRQFAPKSRDREIIAAEFFDPDALPEGVTRSTAARIREFREGIAPDPYW